MSGRLKTAADTAIGITGLFALLGCFAGQLAQAPVILGNKLTGVKADRFNSASVRPAFS